MNYLLPARCSALVLAMICSIAFSWNSESAEQALTPKPEKTRLEVGTAGSGTTSLPLFIALEAGYFAKRGLNVSVNQVGATIAVQGVISGTIDIYQGGTAAIAANLAGADIIYVAAAVDRNSLILFGQKGITSFESLRGKSIATTPAPFSPNELISRQAPRIGSRNGGCAPRPSKPSRMIVACAVLSALGLSAETADATISFSFLLVRGLRSFSPKTRRVSICQPHCASQRAATKASPALCPLPANTMHLPGRGKNLTTARAMPSPACSINASAVIPRAKAASSAVRICAGVMMGECNLFVSVRLFFLLLRLAGRTLFLAARALLLAR